jgi:protein-disulfide isomerase
VNSADRPVTPSGHTPDGGVLIGNPAAGQRLLLFEDPQCPYCREFEDLNGDAISSAVASGELCAEYRMRCFLGPESVRADNALALAAEAGRFDDLPKTQFSPQPPEGTGGFTTEDLLRLGASSGLTDPAFVSGVSTARFVKWVMQQEAIYQAQDPGGTPAAWINGQPIDSSALFDKAAFEQQLRP